MNGTKNKYNCMYDTVKPMGYDPMGIKRKTSITV